MLALIYIQAFAQLDQDETAAAAVTPSTQSATAKAGTSTA